MKRLLVLILLSSHISMAQTDLKPEVIRYVAIGDSYSIGEGVSPSESWPALLTQRLKEKGVRVELVANPSVTGWTTQQAIDRELPVYFRNKPNFATLLIGVNDWVQGVDQKTFRQSLSFLLGQMLSILPSSNRLLVVTIPDFGVTPAGSKYSRGRNISEGIASFNRIICEESKSRGVRVVWRSRPGTSAPGPRRSVPPSAPRYCRNTPRCFSARRS